MSTGFGADSSSWFYFTGWTLYTDTQSQMLLITLPTHRLPQAWVTDPYSSPVPVIIPCSTASVPHSTKSLKNLVKIGPVHGGIELIQKGELILVPVECKPVHQAGQLIPLLGNIMIIFKSSF